MDVVVFLNVPFRSVLVAAAAFAIFTNHFYCQSLPSTTFSLSTIIQTNVATAAKLTSKPQTTSAKLQTTTFVQQQSLFSKTLSSTLPSLSFLTPPSFSMSSPPANQSTLAFIETPSFLIIVLFGAVCCLAGFIGIVYYFVQFKNNNQSEHSNLNDVELKNASKEEINKSKFFMCFLQMPILMVFYLKNPTMNKAILF